MMKKIIIISLLIILASLVSCTGSLQDPLPPYIGTSFYATDNISAPTVIATDNLTVEGSQISPTDFIELYLASPYTVNITSPGTYYNIEVADSLDESHNFSNGSGATYNGTRFHYVLSIATISVQSSAPNVLTTWAIYINGALFSPSSVTNYIATGSDTVVLTTNNLIPMNPGDTLQVVVTADKATTLTIENLMHTVMTLN